MVQHPHRDTRIFQADVLLVTVTEVETMAVRGLFSEKHKHFIQDKTYYNFGEVGGAKVFLVQSEMGAGGQGGAIRTIERGIAILSPSAVIMVGIAFGSDPAKQQIGDILISQQILDYELQRVGSGSNGELAIIPRGDKAAASPRLLNRFRDGAMEWKKANELARVQFGLILSGAKLVDNQDFRKQLRALGPEAIGGEMEGAAQGNKVDWILVKAICDWADGNKGDNEQAYQELAATNAARFVIHVIKQGGLKGEELLKGATLPSKPYTDNLMEPISTQQKTVELLEERIERFKELQVDIVRLKNFKEFRGHLGNLGFTIGELEKRYQRLYQETVHLMQ
jgi:nucleoside phosphorylase